MVAWRKRSIILDLPVSSAGYTDGKPMILTSTITCPKCGHQAIEEMPVDACQFFYDCKGCGARLKPKEGDCCVFCSYGSVPCPPVQTSNGEPLCCQSEDRHH